MAITTFIDPFGSMVQGYKEGQQTEIQRQAGRRAMRDSDYEYGLRQVQDPLRTQALQIGVNQGLLDYLLSGQQGPLKTKTMEEALSALQRQKEFELATQQARIGAANLAPDQVRAELAARAAQTDAARAGTAMTNAQRAGVEFGNLFNERTMRPMIENPVVFNQTLVSRGMDPMTASSITEQYFPVTDLSSELASVLDEMTAKDPIGFANLPRDQQEEAAIKEVLRRNPGVRNFNMVPPGQSAVSPMLSTQGPTQRSAPSAADPDSWEIQ